MDNQYSNFHGKSVAAKDINSYTNYLDRYKATGTAASNWMNDDSNIHFGNYVRDNDSVWEAWVKSGKKDKKDMWEFGKKDWNAGGNMKDRYLAKVLTDPGDLNMTGSHWDDMGVVSAFKSARWGYDQAAQDKLRSSYGKDHWGREGYNSGREMQWYDAKDKTKMYGTTKGVEGGGKAPKDAMRASDVYTQVKGDKGTPKTGGNSANNGSYYNNLSNGNWRNGLPYMEGRTPAPKKDHDGTFYDSYQWVNNNSGEIWKPTPGKRGDFQPGYTVSSGVNGVQDGRMEWAEDPRLQEWTKTPTGKGKRPGKSPYWLGPVKDKEVKSPGAGNTKGKPGDTYVGRGWANYWQQSIPDKDPNWSRTFVDHAFKYGDAGQVVNRDKLAKRIQDRSQKHMENADYLGYLSRGQMRGENRPDWKQPGPIKSDYQPKIDINPFIDKIYNMGNK